MKQVAKNNFHVGWPWWRKEVLLVLYICILDYTFRHSCFLVCIIVEIIKIIGVTFQRGTIFCIQKFMNSVILNSCLHNMECIGGNICWMRETVVCMCMCVLVHMPIHSPIYGMLNVTLYPRLPETYTSKISRFSHVMLLHLVYHIFPKIRSELFPNSSSEKWGWSPFNDTQS